jgi:hypothetical protein
MKEIIDLIVEHILFVRANNQDRFNPVRKTQLKTQLSTGIGEITARVSLFPD